ncbi:T9SS type A sorting domain-containing protein [Puteibacter caeruleilacunae]|nr:T9SS type A sorting domain-containing protein [Puteibacter caeruleilacunae]
MRCLLLILLIVCQSLCLTAQSNKGIKKSESVQLRTEVNELSGQASLTVETWFKLSEVKPGWSQLFNAYKAEDDKKLQVLMNVDAVEHKAQFAVRNGVDDKTYAQYNLETPLFDDDWNHCALIYDGTKSGNEVTILVNGRANTVTKDWSDNLPAMGEPIFINWGNNIEVQYDEMRVWTAPLALDVLNQYKYFNIPTSHPNYGSLVAYYDFEKPLTNEGGVTKIPATIGEDIISNSGLQIVDITDEITFPEYVPGVTEIKELVNYGGNLTLYNGREEDVIQRVGVVLIGDENVDLQTIKFDLSELGSSDSFSNYKVKFISETEEVVFESVTVEGSVLSVTLDKSIPSGVYELVLVGKTDEQMPKGLQVWIPCTELSYQRGEDNLSITARTVNKQYAVVQKIEPVDDTVTNPNTHRVTGWYPRFTNEPQVIEWESQDFTHVYYQGFKLNKHGETERWIIDDHDSDPFPHFDALNRHHANNVKVMISLGLNGEWNDHHTEQIYWSNNLEAFRPIAREMVEELARYKYDGLDWDIENQADQQGYDATAKLLKVVREEMDKVDPKMILTFACSQGGGEMIANTDILNTVDWLNIMSYMYNIRRVGQQMSGGVTPLPDIRNMINGVYKDIPKDKINVGIGWYGRTAIVNPSTGVIEEATREMALSYGDFLKNIEAVATKNVALSNQYSYPCYENEENGKTRRSFIHDQESYKELCEGIKALGVGGICIWDFGKGVSLTGEEKELQRYYVDIHNEVFNDNTTDLEIQKLQPLVVYPNPTRGLLYVTNADQQDYWVYDLHGRIKQQGVISGDRLDISRLRKGLYLLKIGRHVAKIVKQ